MPKIRICKKKKVMISFDISILNKVLFDALLDMTSQFPVP